MSGNHILLSGAANADTHACIGRSTWHTSRSFGTIEALSCVHLASLIVLSFEGGRVVVLLPTCGEGATVKLARSTFNTQTVDVDVDGEGPGAVIVGRGYERQLGGLLRSCHKAARDFLGGLDEVTTDADGPLSLQSGLGFCTWEALGNGTPAKLSTLMHTLDAFEGPLEGGIATLLIDDGWQHISPTNTYTPVDASRTLVSFDLGPHLLDDEEMSESVKDSLPCPRLARYIDRLRRRYRHIQQIGVWMTLSGYWDGLDPDPDGFFARRYGPLRRCKISDALASGPRASREIQLPHANRLDSFWRDCFTAYRSAGVNFVKVDAQSELDWVVDEKGYFDLAWTSLNRAASDVFGPESVIHCMAFGSRLVCGPLSYQSPNRLHLRNSDDTFPQVQEAHTWHLYHNALNSLLTSTHPTIIPDADMFTSKMTGELDWAAFHAAFRAVFSSAKLWISDAPCDSSRKTLGALLALGPSKAGPVIKTVQVGIGVKDAIRSTPLSSSIFSDCVEGPPLIMAARWQDSSGRPTAIISAWNVRSSLRWAYGPLTLTDVAEALDELDEHQHAYMLHSRARRCIEVISATELEKERLNPQIASRPLSGGCFSLPPASWEMVNVVPVLICSLKSSRGADIRIMIGCLGLMEKHAGLACVVDVKQQGPSSFVASLCRAGRCAFAILCEPHHDLHVRMQLDGGEEVAATVEDDFRSDFTVVSFDMLPYVRMNVDGPDQDAWKVRLHLEAL